MNPAERIQTVRLHLSSSTLFYGATRKQGQGEVVSDSNDE